MSTREPLPAFDDRAPSGRYCDLILTGGVTSSIAYPAAVFALAMFYRFNSIGGASSGAGAAALAAAAEYRRRHGSSHGFRIMLERAAEVAEKVDGKTRLEWLFQPEEKNRRLFDALLPGFARPNRKLLALAGGLLRAYARWWIVPAIVFVIICFGAVGAALLDVIDCLTAFLIGASALAPFLVGVVLAMSLLIACDLRRMVQHDYGLCSGSGSGQTSQPPLTDWLHGLIQEIAGRQTDDEPLTFADLADAPGSPQETLNDPCPAGVSSINLQMFTANVTHGRPYIFPQEVGEADDPPLYFGLSEMRGLFPEKVVEYMMEDPVTRQSNLYTGVAELPEERPKAASACWFWSLFIRKSPVAGSKKADMYRLPTKHLPIVVAARMSVSFPVLFKAVPLWSLDARGEKPVFRRCLFCDGGICSTFPIHLFDSPIPSWPTFGIALHELPKRANSKEGAAGAWFAPLEDKELKSGAVWLPEDHLQGREDQWNEFETERKVFERLAGFFNAIVSTATNWNDATLARLPGVRERVVRVGLRPGIGGLNIRMTGDEIRDLADLGREAALKLLKRYALPAPGPSDELSDGWNEHRWVRLNVLRDSLARSLAGLTWAASQAGHGKPLRDLIRQAIDEPVLKKHNDESGLKKRNDESVLKKENDKSVRKDNDSQLLAAQAAALEGALDTLMQAERALNMSTTGQPYRPSPRPVMRVRPPL